MIQHTTFQSDKQNRELLKLSSEGFPYVCNESGYLEGVRNEIPWHWHTALEINYIAEGTHAIRSADGEVVARKGEIIFVNSGVMHRCGGRGPKEAFVRTHLFEPRFLSGMVGSIFEEKYLTPITGCHGIQLVHIRPEDEETVEMIRQVTAAIRCAQEEPAGFEFLIRNHLSCFWMGLFQHTRTLRETAGPRINADTDRIKKMMDYVQTHYQDPISMEEIAAAAGVGVRECSRCFQRSLGTSPGKYVARFRLRQAAGMLASTDQPVTDIAMECGFGSPSHFAKAFKDAYGCTPRSYRMRQQGGE